MLEKILVPTDGSELSERAFPYATLIAKAQGAAVTLVRVLEPFVPGTFGAGYMDGYLDPDTYDQIWAAIREDASDQLNRNRETLQAAGVKTEVQLIDGLASSSLLDFEAHFKPDLMVMATHGRSGLARFALGSVTDRLVREGSTPVLLIPAFAQAEPRLARALVPLDGSSVSEQALPLVEALASKPLINVELLTAVGGESGGEGVYDDVAEAREYLLPIAERLSRSGLTTESTVSQERAIDAIEREAANVDVVIMSTHGRSGLDRWRHGSVADQATHHLTIPRLLIRAHP